MEEKKEKGERAFGVGLLRKKRDRKGKETVGSSSCWSCKDETANGLGVDGSGMGMVLEVVVVTGGIGVVLGPGAWGLGNWQLAIGGGMGVSLDWNSRGSSPKRDHPDRERLIQAASGGVRR